MSSGAANAKNNLIQRSFSGGRAEPLPPLILYCSFCRNVIEEESFCVFKNKNHHFPLKISHIRVFWGKDMLAIPK